MEHGGVIIPVALFALVGILGRLVVAILGLGCGGSGWHRHSVQTPHRSASALSRDH